MISSLWVFLSLNKIDNNQQNNLIDLQKEEYFKGENRIFEEVKHEGEEPELGIDDPPKMYILELKGTCRLTDLDQYAEDFSEFSKKFAPYVQFRSSTL